MQEIKYVPMDQIKVLNADPSSTRIQSFAAIIMEPEALNDGRLDPRCLFAVFDALQRRTVYEVALTPAPGNDLATTLNYIVEPPRDVPLTKREIETTHTKEMAEWCLQNVLEAQGGKLDITWNFTVNKVDGVMRGGCCDYNPLSCEKFAFHSPYHLANGYKLTVTRPKWIQPTYLSTLVLYIGRSPLFSLDAFKRQLNTLAARFNKDNNKKTYVTNFSASAGGRFFQCDPSHPDLADSWGTAGWVAVVGWVALPLHFSSVPAAT